jgi:hypothetical protein
LQQFLGRKVDYQKGSQHITTPWNATKRGISGDCSLIVLFTSNYQLEKPCTDALQRLEMFHNLQPMDMTAVDGKDRRDFAYSYMRQCIQDHFSADVNPVLELDIPFGEGDTRPLVCHIRKLVFYMCALLKD